MAFVVEIVFRGNGSDRLGLAEAHRTYWKRMAARGILLGGGPWRDGTGELLVCEAPDRRTLLRVLYADPYAQAQLIGEVRIREWNATMGPVVLADLTAQQLPLFDNLPVGLYTMAVGGAYLGYLLLREWGRRPA